MRYLCIYLIIGFFTLNFTCKSLSKTDNPVYSSSINMEIRTKTNETFEVEVESTPSSGFQWLVVEPIDAKIEYVDTRYDDTAKDDSEGFMINNTVHQWMIFRALKSGEATLQLKYAQPFNPDDPEAETQSYKVVIE